MSLPSSRHATSASFTTHQQLNPPNLLNPPNPFVQGERVWCDASEEFTSPLEAPASSAQRAYRTHCRPHSPAHEQTVAAEQRTTGELECASREFLRAIACHAKQRHCAFSSCAESDGQPRLAARELRVESTVLCRQSDAGAYCNCTRVVHCQHSQLC